MRNVTVLLAVLAMVAGTAGATIYSTDFESFTVGTVDGQDGGVWVNNRSLSDVVDGSYSPITPNIIQGEKSLGLQTDQNNWLKYGANAYLNHAATAGIVTVQYDTSTTSETEGMRVLPRDTVNGIYGGQVRFTDDANNGTSDITVSDGKSNYVVVGTFVANQTYNVKMVMDCTTFTYDTYLDGVLVADDFYFDTASTPGGAFGLDQISIGTRIGVANDSTQVASDDWATLDNLTVIPEPATMVLLGIGGIGVLLRKRRK